MIDEKKLIDEFKEQIRKSSTPWTHYGNVIKTVAEQPKVDDWIPCCERLPEDGEDVLVWYEYFRYGNFNCMYQTHGIGYQYGGHWDGDVIGKNARCIAWMPLPDPYKEEGETDE